jgi:hypothetical protein
VRLRIGVDARDGVAVDRGPELRHGGAAGLAEGDDENGDEDDGEWRTSELDQAPSGG